MQWRYWSLQVGSRTHPLCIAEALGTVSPEPRRRPVGRKRDFLLLELANSPTTVVKAWQRPLYLASVLEENAVFKIGYAGPKDLNKIPTGSLVVFPLKLPIVHRNIQTWSNHLNNILNTHPSFQPFRMTTQITALKSRSKGNNTLNHRQHF